MIWTNGPYPFGEEEKMNEDMRKYIENCIRWEGCVNHMYLDTRGLVTVGIGNLLKTFADAEKLPFYIGKECRKATAVEIRINYDFVLQMDPGLKASKYKQNPNLILKQDAIDELCASRIENEFLPGIKKHFKGFDNYPIGAREVLVDMAYNMGVRNLSTFKKLRRHCEAARWSLAADETKVATSKPARNNWRAKTMRGCV